MSPYLQLDDPGRRRAIEEASARLNLLPMVLEKDYWVSWLLGRLFEDREVGPRVVFKGGTSLSKVFKVIDRFSEDIDLSVSPEAVGFDPAKLDEAPSKTKRDGLFRDLQLACSKYVQGTFQPRLENAIRSVLGKGAWLEFQDDPRSPALVFTYPTCLKVESGYIRPAVKLEFGSLTDQQPTGSHEITSLMAEALPALGEAPVKVVALEVERTFWEKATILHSEHHRPADKAIPERFARHYFDFAALWGHAASKAAALNRVDLLARVSDFKERYFRSGWSNYAGARIPTLKLRPPSARESELRIDYKKMEPMFMKPPPSFESLMGLLGSAEREINGLGGSR